LHLIGLEAHGQTQLPEVATGAGDFDAEHVHDVTFNTC